MTIRLVTVSTLFPNQAMPSHGVFVETRLRHLVADEDVTSVVIAPVPWFPTTDSRFGAWSRHAAAPRNEIRFGLDVRHPRYLVVPKFGQALTPHTLFRTLKPALAALLAEGYRPDAIDGHYLYPDGVAAAWLARHFNLPLVLTARGSDVTQWPDFPRPRALITEALDQADALITVSQALAEGVRALGIDPHKITTLRNGVDTEIFNPIEPSTARAAIGQTNRYILSVGHLIPRKGHDRVIEAFARLATAQLAGHDLIIAGDGPERAALGDLAAAHGLFSRVKLIGAMPQPRLPLYYSGADCLVLASSREGWANVLLEAMACGTPVVASPAAGNDEVVRSRAAGLIAADFSAASLAAGLDTLLADPPDRGATTAYAEAHDWRTISAGQREIFTRVINQRQPARVRELARSG
ncbi:glycosyltransferase family 4 protein [Acidiphilium sp.]|uniref:glycosyltransferase family 4 protein n=1 Tax=Acidiphilium sp. TaxID=527 RepID=UPI003D01976C